MDEPGDCVEIAPTAATIHVRDSKNAAGPRLTLGPAAWSSFVAPCRRLSRTGLVTPRPAVPLSPGSNRRSSPGR
ncbi:DUF397 domain-containing protein [Streptomyces phaeochromogenes]